MRHSQRTSDDHLKDFYLSSNKFLFHTVSHLPSLIEHSLCPQFLVFRQVCKISTEIARGGEGEKGGAHGNS